MTLLDGRRPMPLTLRRVHLRSVGPDKARFDPLDLDLRAPAGVAERVLWSLTNTGGKTTLIRLIMSVLVPHAREQMGGANIGEYVQTGDTSHIVLEWEDGAGTRFVVGAVYEWPSRTKPRDVPISQLARAWYIFRSHDVGIDDLPFDTDGKRRTLDAFRVDLFDLLDTSKHPSAHFGWTRHQNEWAQFLDERTPLDPELFRYQMRMNDSESGAGELVSRLSSPEEVVRFFIEALNDDVALGDFAKTLSEYAASAAQRGAWQVEHGFCEALAAALMRLDDAHRTLSDWKNVQETSQLAVAELTSGIASRITAEHTAMRELATDHTSASHQVDDLKRSDNTGEDMRAQLFLERARLAAAAAAEAVARRTEARDTAEAERDAWAAVSTIQDWTMARNRAEEARLAYERVERGLAPLRAREHAAGGQLAAKFRAFADDARRQADEARVRVRGAIAAREEAQHDEDEERKALDRAREQLRRLDERRADLDREVSEQRSAGVLAPGESAVEGIERHDREHGAAEARHDAARTRRAMLDGELGELAARRARMEGELRDATKDADRAERQLETYGADRSTLLANELVAELAAEPVDDVRHAARLQPLAEERAKHAEHHAATLEERRVTIAHELDALERDELASAPADVQLVCDTLVAAGIGTTTGLSWLARNVADSDDRERVITCNPALANGVVVSDPARYATARQLLERDPPRVRSSVLVTDSQRALGADAMDGTPSTVHVVTPWRAMWDRAWAAETAAELRVELTDIETAAKASSERATAARIAAVSLGAFVERWADIESALDAELQATRNRVENAQRELDKITDATAMAEAGRAAANDEITEMTGRLATTNAHLTTLRALRERFGAWTHDNARRTAIERNRAAAEQQITDARRKLERAQAEHDEQLARELQLGGDAASWRDKQQNVGVEPAGVAPPETLRELEASFDEAHARRMSEERGSDHAARRDETETDAARSAAVVDELPPAVRDAAIARSASLDAANAGLLRRAITLADEGYKAALGALGEAERDLVAANKEIENRSPERRQSHIVLSDDWIPTSVSHADALIEYIDALLFETREQLREANARFQRLDGALVTTSAAIDGLKVAFEMAGEDIAATPGGPEFDGTPEEARALMRARLKDRTEAADLVNQAEGKRWDALNDVKDVARDEAWNAVKSPIRERCKLGDADDLAMQAETWMPMLQVRARSLGDDLRDLDRHRDVLVDQLQSLCSTQLARLREVNRASRLPAGLGGLSDQPAFKITFEAASAADSRARLVARVDDWAAGLADGKRVDRQQRIRWLTEATRDLVRPGERSGPWRVEVLKPPVDETVEYRSPDRIHVEYSGGQELTLAVLLYCTLAKVRARNRSGRSRPPGVLIIDNPFGRASNPALIKMQQGLAAASGVQLICATGLDDPSILSAFEGDSGRVLRLRNDRDQRHGLQYLRIADSAIAERVATSAARGRDIDDPNGYVDAIGYSIRDAQ
jgi:hypothetical protein